MCNQPTPDSKNQFELEKQLHEQYAINNNAKVSSFVSFIVALFALFGFYGYIFAHSGYQFSLEGRNAIAEALKSGRTIDKLFIASGDTDKNLQRLAAQAKDAGAVIVPVDRRKLDAMSFTRSHQGVIALAAAHDYYTIDDILEEAAGRGEAPLIVICDELSDPHNLGAILRSAECAGAHGVIIPKRRSVGLTATVRAPHGRSSRPEC